MYGPHKETTLVEFPDATGHILRGILTKPDKATRGVLMLHGFERKGARSVRSCGPQRLRSKHRGDCSSGEVAVSKDRAHCARTQSAKTAPLLVCESFRKEKRSCYFHYMGKLRKPAR